MDWALELIESLDLGEEALLYDSDPTAVAEALAASCEEFQIEPNDVQELQSLADEKEVQGRFGKHVEALSNALPTIGVPLVTQAIKTAPQSGHDNPGSSASTEAHPTIAQRNKKTVRVEDERQVSMTQCPCGASYPYLTWKCPTCRGMDPMGALWKNHSGSILEALRAQITDPLMPSEAYGICGALAEIQKGIGAVLVNSGVGEKLEEIDNASPEDAAQALVGLMESMEKVSYYLRRERIDTLRARMESEVPSMGKVIRTAADHYCKEFSLYEKPWEYPESMEVELTQNLTNIWRPSLRRFGRELTNAFLKASLAQARFKNTWLKSKEGMSDLRKAWIFGKAVKTGGASLIYDSVNAILKNKRDKDKFLEEFKQLQNDLIALVSRSYIIRDGIETAKREHRQLLNSIGKRYASDLIFSLADVYGPKEPSEQEAIANKVALVSGIGGWKRERYGERGPQLIKRRQRIFAADLVLILIVVTYLVILLLQALNVIDVLPW